MLHLGRSVNCVFTFGNVVDLTTVMTEPLKMIRSKRPAYRRTAGFLSAQQFSRALIKLKTMTDFRQKDSLSRIALNNYQIL